MSNVKRHLKAHLLEAGEDRVVSSIQEMLQTTAQAPQEIEPFELQDCRPEPLGGWRKSLLAFSISARLMKLDQRPEWPIILKREISYAMAADLERQAFWAGRETGKPNILMAQLMGRWLNHVEELHKVQ